MKSLKNYILAMSVTSILVIYAGSVSLPALTTVPAFATNDTTDDTTTDTTDDTTTDTTDDTTTDTTDDTTTDTTDNNNNDTMLFLIDVIQCFTNNENNNDLIGNNNNDDEQFSENVQVCLNDVIGQYFNNDSNLDNNNDSQDNNNISSDDNNNIEPSSQET
jgi:hypothetical protein